MRPHAAKPTATKGGPLRSKNIKETRVQISRLLIDLENVTELRDQWFVSKDETSKLWTQSAELTKKRLLIIILLNCNVAKGSREILPVKTHLPDFALLSQQLRILHHLSSRRFGSDKVRITCNISKAAGSSEAVICRHLVWQQSVFMPEMCGE